MNVSFLHRLPVVCFLALVLGFFLPHSARSATPEILHQELGTAKLRPSLYGSVFRVPVMNVRSGDIRYMTAFRDISRDRLNAQLSGTGEQDSQLFPSAPILRTLPDGSLDCDCGPALRENEFIISETDVYDHRQGHFVSLNDESFKAIQELLNYPLEDDETISVAFSELVYVYNARAIDNFLSNRGFDLVYSYGFMDSATYPGDDDTQFVLVRERRTGRFIIAIRGTSGVADLKTNINAAMEPWIGAGRVHSGFARTTSVIAAELNQFEDQIRSSGLPTLIVGHSLGGAASILLTIELDQQGFDVHAINIAPPPLGDYIFEDHYTEISAKLVNMFLPGEELDTANKPREFQWMRLVGDKRYLEDVGTTAGAVHFVVNYLKSTLKARGDNMDRYAESLPICVFEKFSCFQDDLLAFVPLCLLDDWACFERHVGKLMRLEPASDKLAGIKLLDQIIARQVKSGDSEPLLNRELLSAIYSQSKHSLLDSPDSENQRLLLKLRLGLIAVVLGKSDEATRFFAAISGDHGTQQIVRYLRIVSLVLEGRDDEAIELSVALFNSEPSAEVARRTRELLWGKAVQ